MLVFFFCLFCVHAQTTHATSLEAFCDADVAVPDDLIHCGSCSGRCGSGSSMDSSSRPICNCDKFCLLYGDCCHDFKETCFGVFVEAYAVRAPFLQQFGSQQFKCVSDIMVMATCSNGSACAYSTVLNDDVNTFVPMYDVTKKVHYISGYCAICNGAVNVIPWDVSLRCSRTIKPGISNDQTDRSTINSTQSFNQIRQSASCSLRLNKPVTAQSRKCVPSVLSSCRSNCLNEELIKQCLTSSSEYTYLGLNALYKNPYCVLCGDHTYSQSTIEDLSCFPGSLSPPPPSPPPPSPPPPPPLPPPTPPSPPPPPPSSPLSPPRFVPTDVRFPSLPRDIDPFSPIGIPVHPPEVAPSPDFGSIPTFESFSLTVVFDFDPRRGLAIGDQKSYGCDPGEAYHLDEGVCRTVACPSGLRLDGRTCLPEVSAIVVVVNSTLESSLPNEAINATLENPELLQNRLLVVIWSFLHSHAIEPLQLQVKADIQTDNISLKTTTTITCNCDYSKLIRFDNNGEDIDVDLEFRHRLVNVVRETVLSYILSNGVKPNRISTEFFVEKQNASFSIQQTWCIWIVYDLHETIVKNNSVEIIATGKTFGSNSFEVMTDTVIVCEVEGEDTIPFALGVVTVVCIGLSIVCLLIRILLQICITIFATIPGKLQFNLTVAFLVAFVFLVVAPLTRDSHTGCVVSAVVLCYGFLAAFTWMNVIAFDTWLAFRPSAAFVRSGEKVKSLWRHMLIGWGFPLVFVAIAIGVDYSNAKMTYRPNFGGLRCWFTQRIALMTYFGLPVAISIVLNIFFYVLTAMNLRRAFKDKKSRKTQQNEHHFLVYVRLFVLMGFTWIFGFLSAFTDEVAIDFVFVILTSLQGVFLFVSFVCNKRVFNELKKKIKMRKRSNDKRSTDTPLEKKDTNDDAKQNGKTGSKGGNSTEKKKHENDALRNIETKNKKEKTEMVQLGKQKKALMPNLERSRESIKDRIFSEIRRNQRKKHLDKSSDDEMKGADTNYGKRESVA